MAFLSQDSRMGVPKSRQPGLLRLWSPVTLLADLGSKCSLKKSCSSHRELSNGMRHVVCNQVNRVDSWLFLVGSQTGSLTPGPSFGHNLCFRCLNEQWEPILDIYVPRSFQWYKERHNPLRFDPSNQSLKFWESTETPSPKVGVALGVWGLTPSHSPALSRVYDVTPGLPLGPHPCNPFTLVASPKLRLQQWGFIPSHSLALSRAWNVTPGLPSWPTHSQALALVMNPRLRLWHGTCSFSNKSRFNITS